jgi:purine nucleoside phosphorylase
MTDGVKVGLIGGYGIQDAIGPTTEASFEATFPDEGIAGDRPTYTVFSGSIDDVSVLAIPRHGVSHSYPPHSVPVKSYVDTLASEGVSCLVTTNSVGVMSTEYDVPCFFLLDDFVNEGREVTFFDTFPESPVHVNMSAPYDPELQALAREAADDLDVPLYEDVTYVNSRGPRLETEAEIRNKYMPLGDVIGMTGAPEAILAAEKELPLLGIGLGVNYAEGIEAVDPDAVIERSEQLQDDVRALVTHVIRRLE